MTSQVGTPRGNRETSWQALRTLASFSSKMLRNFSVVICVQPASTWGQVHRCQPHAILLKVTAAICCEQRGHSSDGKKIHPGLITGYEATTVRSENEIFSSSESPSIEPTCFAILTSSSASCSSSLLFKAGSVLSENTTNPRMSLREQSFLLRTSTLGHRRSLHRLLVATCSRS